MGGINCGRVLLPDGSVVGLNRGDLCEVRLNIWGEYCNKLCVFDDTSDDGDLYFRFYSEEDSVRGESFVSSHWMEFVEVTKHIGPRETLEMFQGEGI